MPDRPPPAADAATIIANLKLPYVYFTPDMLADLIVAGLIDLRTGLYFYLLFNCDLSRARSHPTNYKEVAKLFGCHEESLVRAARQLEEAGLIDRKSTGDFVADLPALVRSKAQQEARNLEKKEKPF